MTRSLTATVLVVEDEPRLVRLIRAILETANYRVLTVPTGDRAIHHAAIDNPDLIILDLLLPGTLDGYAVAERIREFSTVPIIMVTARTHESDRLRGFETGADDYITKPFSAPELLARVKAVLRRTQVADRSESTVNLGDIAIDLATQTISGPEGPVHLTPTERRLLLTLARNADRLMTHNAILQDVWGTAFQGDINNVRTYVRYLRKKIEPDPANPTYLQTISGVGYMLVTSPQGADTEA